MLTQSHSRSTPGGHRTLSRHTLESSQRRPAAAGWLSILDGWIQRRRQRRDLAALDDRLLRDIGITPEQAGREIAKPFWR